MEIINWIYLGIGFGVSSVILTLIYFLFIRKSKKEYASLDRNLLSLIAPEGYEPKGRVGYIRVREDAVHGVIVVEEVDRIDNVSAGKTSAHKPMVKIKILEVTIDFNSNCTQEDVLIKWGGNEWWYPSYFVWHEFTEAEKREKKINGIVGEED